MNSFNDVVTKAVSDITGLRTDVTTVVVGVILIVVILVGLDFLRNLMFDAGDSSFVSSSEEESKHKKAMTGDHSVCYKRKWDRHE